MLLVEDKRYYGMQERCSEREFKISPGLGNYEFPKTLKVLDLLFRLGRSCAGRDNDIIYIHIHNRFMAATNQSIGRVGTTLDQTRQLARVRLTHDE